MVIANRVAEFPCLYPLWFVAACWVGGGVGFGCRVVVLLLLVIQLFAPDATGTDRGCVGGLCPSSGSRFRALVRGVEGSFTRGPLVSRFLRGCSATGNYFASISCDHHSHAG